MDEFFKQTDDLLRVLDNNSEVIGAKLSRGNIDEALKYNLIDLVASFRELKSLYKRESAFLNVYGMICRAAQESTATVLYLSSKTKEKHKKYCNDLIYNSDLLHYVYHVLEDENDEEYVQKALRDDIWSWTKSSYKHRISKSLGASEAAFYEYTSALAHYSMVNNYFLNAHPEDFQIIYELFLFKICKYIHLTISKMVEFKTKTNAVVLLQSGTYLSRTKPILDDLGNFELNKILSIKRFAPHKH